MNSLIKPWKKSKILEIKNIYDNDNNFYEFFTNPETGHFEKIISYYPNKKIKQEIYLSYHKLFIKNSCDYCKHLDEYFRSTYKWFNHIPVNFDADEADKPYCNWPIDLQEAPYCDKCFRFKWNNRKVLYLNFGTKFKKRLNNGNIPEKAYDILISDHPDYTSCNWIRDEKFQWISNQYEIFLEKIYEDIILERYFVSRIDNSDYPSYIEYSETGEKIYEIYTRDGIVHREGGPAYIFKDDDSTIELFYEEGRVHRKNLPAYIKKNNHQVKILMYYLNGYEHREDGPSYIGYSYDGNNIKKITKQYCLYGGDKVPRKDGNPSYEIINHDGRTLKQWFHYQDCYDPPYHRIGGPSNIGYFDLEGIGDEDDEPVEEYWIYGQEYTKEEYYNIMRKFKKLSQLWKNKKRNLIRQTLNTTKINKIGSDIINLISNFF